MKREEIVTALRCHCDAIETGKCPKDKCPSFERPARYKCAGVVSGEAADLIEDGMKGILLHDDSRRWVKGIEHYFHDKPYIRVTITEVEP